MKKLLVSILAVGFLASCTTEKTVYVPTETPVEDSSDYVEPSKSIDDLYIENNYNAYPELQQMGRQWLIDLGKEICNSIDTGTTAREIIAMVIETGVDPEMFGFVMGSAIAAYCPQNEWFINEF